MTCHCYVWKTDVRGVARGPSDIGFRGPNGPIATQTKDRQVSCIVLNGVKKVVDVFM
jgi:hypothetical protein